MRMSRTLSIVFFFYTVLLLLFCVRQAFAAESASALQLRQAQLPSGR